MTLESIKLLSVFLVGFAFGMALIAYLLHRSAPDNRPVLELIGAEYQHTETGRILACIGNKPPSTRWLHVRNIYAGP